jgi:hypothetical protein
MKSTCLSALIIIISSYFSVQHYLGFGLLHKIIPGFSVFDDLAPVSQF